MAQLTSITGLQNLVNLQEIRIDYNGFQSVDLSGMSNLTYVDISDCDIPGTGTNSLTSVNLAGSTAIEQLRLDDSNFSAGYPDISGLTNTLQILDMDQCGLSGVIDLSQFSALTSIDFSGNINITSVTLPEAYINNLNLYNNALTQEAVDDTLQWLDGSGVENGYVSLEGGTNAVPTEAGLTAQTNLEGKGWSVYVNTAPPGSVGIAASTDFDISGSFTIEMFVNMNNLDGFPRPYSFGAYPAPNAMSIEGGSLYFWANNSSLINGTFNPTLGEWNHIAVMGSGSTAYMFINGFMVANSPYDGEISSQGLPLTIGYGNEPNSGFNGLMSNFRWTDAAVYPTGGFTPPTGSLTDLTDTVLLIFQGTDINAQLLDNSGNNHNATNSGATYSVLNPFTGTTGSLQMGNI
jgi:hypothetical protein